MRSIEIEAMPPKKQKLNKVNNHTILIMRDKRRVKKNFVFQKDVNHGIIQMVN